jgi:serine/threonine-protein kinase
MMRLSLLWLMVAGVGCGGLVTPEDNSTDARRRRGDMATASGGTTGTGGGGSVDGGAGDPSPTSGDLGQTADLSDPISSGSGSGGGGGGTSSGTTLFPSTAPWYQDITSAPKDGQSDAAIAAINSKGGWGGGAIHIDFSPIVLHADASTPMRSFTPTGDFYEPDCDQVAMPVPAGGAVEGESGYACVGDGDCHLLVIHDAQKKLYEMWRANISGTSFAGGCLAVWDLTRDYAPHGRGEGCTSADAGGFPMSALLFDADEVAAGHIDHAIRFILPNDRIGKGSYVHPATHSTYASASTVAPNSPPYGARFRLRADYPVASLPSAGARVVARAMQKYGMFLSDGGNDALTAVSDRFTTHKWSGVLSRNDLTALKPGDFVMVDGGARVPYSTSSDCIRQ